jgi:hypothetical protein
MMARRATSSTRPAGVSNDECRQLLSIEAAKTGYITVSADQFSTVVAENKNQSREPRLETHRMKPLRA